MFNIHLSHAGVRIAVSWLCAKKLMVKNSFIEKTNVVGTHWNCLNRGNSNVYLRHVTENKQEN